MVEVQYISQFGNRLFQYCLGRIIAETLGYALEADPIPGFPETARPVTGADHRGRAVQRLVRHRVDLDGVLADRTPRHIVLRGWFQRYEYYAKHADRVRRWMATDQEPPWPPGPREVTLHVRRGDYVTDRPCNALPLSYYTDALKLVDHDRVNICTDEPDDPWFRAGALRDARLVPGTMQDHFHFLRRSKVIVMSQSTFSWWAAFLSEATHVFTPVPMNGYWSGHRDIDLTVSEPRYHPVACRERYQPSRREQLWRAQRVIKERLGG